MFPSGEFVGRQIEIIILYDSIYLSGLQFPLENLGVNSSMFIIFRWDFFFV